MKSVPITHTRGGSVFDTTSGHNLYLWLAATVWNSLVTLDSSTNFDPHDIIFLISIFESGISTHKTRILAILSLLSLFYCFLYLTENCIKGFCWICPLIFYIASQYGIWWYFRIIEGMLPPFSSSALKTHYLPCLEFHPYSR